MTEVAIQVFEFGGRRVRTAGTHERPLFCAADVCAALGIEKPENAYARLDQDETELVPVERVGGRKHAVFVTESGLFALILGSRKAEARAFRKWVTSEVLPEIRKRGFYSVLKAQEAQQTERLLAECFPNLPKKAEPIFRELIAALIRMRRENGERGNPVWARGLAQLVYGWAIHVPGQQEYRRTKNPKPNGSRTDHSMFGDIAEESVKRVVHVGCAFAVTCKSWAQWKTQMEIVCGKRAVQLPLMVPVLELPTSGVRNG